MSFWKRLFYASRIKDAKPKTEPDTITNDMIELLGYKSSCEAIQYHINSFLYNAGEGNGSRLYLGELNKIFPNCQLLANGRNYGQVYSIGYVFETLDVVVNTEAGRLIIKRS